MGVVDVYVYAYLQCGVQVKEKLHNKKDRLILDMRFNFIQNVCYKLFLAFPKLVGFHQYRKNSKCEFIFHNDECSIYSIVWFFFFFAITNPNTIRPQKTDKL